MNIRVAGILLLGNLTLVGCNLDLGMSEDKSEGTLQAENDAAVTAEDTAVTLAVLANDTDSGGGTLTVKAISQPAHGQAVINPDQTVTYTPTTNFNGTDSFAYTLSNGESESGAEVTITVTPVNDAPTISPIADQTIDQGNSTGPLAFTIGDVETAANVLTVTATSNNPALIPNTNLVLAGSGASRTITATPAANANGSAVITVSVSDGSDTTNTTFTVTVNPVNDPPTITPIVNQTINEDTTTGPLAFTIGDIDNPITALTVTATSNNPALLPNTNLVLAGSGASRTITATPAVNANGSAVITVSVSDGSDTTNTTFTVTMSPVNDPPVRTAGNVSDLRVLQGSGLTSLGLDGLAYSPGPANESNQTLTYTITQVPAANLGNIVLADGTIVSAGSSYSLGQLQSMQFSTATGNTSTTGVGSFSFSVIDNGGTANGGIDTLTQSLTVTVMPPPAPVPRTGQTACYDQNGTQLDNCANTGQDGDKRAGVAWPTPRFVDNNDGTVTDKLTGLVWLKDANCFGAVVWQTALDDANKLANGQCDLKDGSTAGQWRLPNRREQISLGDVQQFNPALPVGYPFANVQMVGYYWSSVSDVAQPANAWSTSLYSIGVSTHNKTQIQTDYVWPVRDGLPGTVPAPVPRTGQTTCYDQYGTQIGCADTGQDGDKQAGVAWPTPRFTDNGDGTVTDQLTALIWLKNANCFGAVAWQTALNNANNLANGQCDLKDGSTAGQWRLPNAKELESLIDYEYSNPVLSNTEGTGKWTEGNVFSRVQSALYWSSTSQVDNPVNAWPVDFSRTGTVPINSNKIDGKNYVWPVRGGQLP